jgi:hypothetical protein
MFLVQSNGTLCENIEADTRIIMHLTFVSELHPDGVVVIRCNDTECAVHSLSPHEEDFHHSDRY